MVMGVCEWLTGITKIAFRRVVENKYLSEEVKTAPAEVETIINSLPITQVTVDAIEILKSINFINPWARLGNSLQKGGKEK